MPPKRRPSRAPMVASALTRRLSSPHDPPSKRRGANTSPRKVDPGLPSARVDFLPRRVAPSTLARDDAIGKTQDLQERLRRLGGSRRALRDDDSGDMFGSVFDEGTTVSLSSNVGRRRPSNDSFPIGDDEDGNEGCEGEEEEEDEGEPCEGDEGEYDECRECGECLYDTDPRYLHWPCHYDCGLARRSLEGMMDTAADAAALKKMKLKDAAKYHQCIKRMKKKNFVNKGIKSKRGQQRARQGQKRPPGVLAEVRKTIDEFKHTIDVGSSKGCKMLTKRQFVARMQSKEGMKKVAAKALWFKRIKDPAYHTNYEDGELVLATKRPTSWNENETLKVTKHRGKATPANMKAVASQMFQGHHHAVLKSAGGRIMSKASSAPAISGTIKVNTDSDDSDDNYEEEEEEESESEDGDEDREDDADTPKPTAAGGGGRGGASLRRRLVGKGGVRL